MLKAEKFLEHDSLLSKSKSIHERVLLHKLGKTKPIAPTAAYLEINSKNLQMTSAKQASSTYKCFTFVM
jgi:hypothetical protein